MITVGLPAAGKDTFFNEIKAIKNWVHISSDKIREEVFGDVNDQSHNPEVFDIMFKGTIEALDNDWNVYYNATNLSAKYRKRLIHEIKKHRELKGLEDIRVTCALFVVPYEECLIRNRERSRTVPEHVMKRMYMSFQPPCEAEGFDNIIIIGAKPNTCFLERLKEICDVTPHDNPNHRLSLGGHMRAAHKYLIDNSAIYINKCHHWSAVSEAASMHDIGKLFCKTFVNSRGETTTKAHYYNHEYVGAYLYLCYGRGDASFKLYVANLIANHMSFFGGEKRLERIRQKHGEDFYNDLCILHECDVAAH